MTTRAGIGIVGLGFGERVLLPAFRANAGCEVVAVAAGRPAKARAIAEREGLTAYEEWPALVAEPPVTGVGTVAAGGGALNDFAPHVLYYLEWLLGPIDRIWAAPQPDADRDVLAVLALEFRDGPTGAVTIATAAPLGDGHAMTVYGEQGALAL